MRPRCSIDGCEADASARSMCRFHYQRWYRGRPLTIPSLRADEPERFFRHVAVSDDCWLWTGTRGRYGYGQFRQSGQPGKMVRAHRWIYEFCIAPIPGGMQIDHLCRNTSCVNPSHLEVVTEAENLRRKRGYNLKTHCKYGHAFTPENTGLYPRPNGAVARQCKTCNRERKRVVR